MRKVMGKNTVAWLRSYCSFVLILTIVLGDSFVFLNEGFLRAPLAEAATGDFSVFREVTGGEVVTSSGFDVTWDTAVTESSNIALAGNSTDITLSEGGKYLVLYNVWTEEGGAGGANRRSVASYLTLDGVPLEYGRGSGYIRDAENDLTAYNSGAAIITASANQDLRVVTTRQDSNPTAGAAIRPGKNGVSVVQLDDSLDYLRVHKSSASSDISALTTFTGVTWDTSDEVDTDSFDFSPTSADITLKGGVDQFFLATVNVNLNVTGTANQRQNYEMRLTLDGVEVPGTRSTTYLRYTDGVINGTMQYVGLVKKTAVGDQVFNVEIRRESQTGDTTVIVADQSAVSLVALPASAEVLSLTNSANQLLTSASSVMNWNQQLYTAPSRFAHSTTTNNDNIEINSAGNYLFFASTYTSRSAGTGRDVPQIEWRVDNALQAYGGHGSFNRGDQGTQDAYTSGASSGVLFPGLTSGQIVELMQSDESTGVPVSNFIASRVGLQALELSALIPSATTNVFVNGVQPATSSPGVNNFALGESIAIVEDVASRNVTSITLTETGTIDAANNLSSVRVFYDLDTSAPYDCESESYVGGESQFGATSTFSGADGTASFNSSVQISPTQALCAYVFLDIGTGASDGETLNVLLDNPVSDVVVTAGGSVNPPSQLGVTQTVIEDAEITQTGYHWRNDDGSESAATSATGGVENTPGLSFSTTSPKRLRVGVAVKGTGSQAKSYRLEYGEKVTTCGDVSSWTDVGSGGGAWDMFDSTFLAESFSTTNIAEAIGGVSDGADIFKTPNGGVRDASSQTGSITLSDAPVAIGESGTSSVTNGLTTTINLTKTFVDPVVVASARYSRTGTQRTTRITNKTSNSFDVLVDNFDSSLGAGSTIIDYLVFEAGEWIVADGSTGTKIFATTTNTAVNAGRSLPANPGGAVVTYPSSFTNPAVLASLVTDNDPDWAFASVYDGVDVDNPPSGTSLTAFINDNWDADGHTAAEDIDIIVFEEGSGINNSNNFDFTSSGAVVTNTPISVSYSSAYSSTPEVIILQAMTQLGADGGYALVDEDTAPTAIAATLATDEDGLGADRGHAAEDVAMISFAKPGLLLAQDIIQSEFVELEYSVQATNAALEGVAYCFRVSNAGTALRNYDVYPEATLSADVSVQATGTQFASVDSGSVANYSGGVFTIADNSGSRTVSEITLTELGSVDATYLTDIELYYEFDTTAPYDCESESFTGTEAQFGATAASFSAANGTTTFSDSVGITTSSTMCVYPVYSVSNIVQDGDVIELAINNPSFDVIVSAGSVGPGSVLGLDGSTVVNAPMLTQTGYHWRNDDGNEAGATSATGGSENTAIGSVFQNTTKRLRVAVSNEGSITAVDTALRLEYGTKVTTCENVGAWQSVRAGAAFTVASSSTLVQGSDTQDIALGIGGVTNPNDDFLSPNSAQLETEDQLATTSLTSTEFVEIEYAIQPTAASAFSATYCFRVTNAGNQLPVYSQYPELTMQDRQDFMIRQGTTTVSGAGVTLVAGVDYVAPASSSRAFVRITNTSMTGAGSETLGSTQNPDDLFAYITSASDLSAGFTITRPPAATGNTRVSWEIIEYIGVVGGDNEITIRNVGVVTYSGSSLTATGTVVSGVVDDSDVVVFITGQLNPAASTADYNTGLSVSSWASDSSQPVFERGDADGIAAGVSYAVVEFTGASWNVQRVEHTFAAAGVAETEPIIAVNSLLRTFVHAQKLSGDELFNLDESGHEVWLSSIGAVSFELESGSTNPSQQRSVAWVIESTQTGDGSMRVYRSNGLIAQNTTQPNAFIYSIGATVQPENASIWATNRSTGGGNAHPRALLGARIVNSTQFELWKSDEGQNQNFRVEVVDWPVADTSLRQSAYRFYVDNDALTPVDAWPPGASDIGENTAITDIDDPLGAGERVRIRTSLLVNNASLVMNSKSLKLQYARRIVTCSAISEWFDVGAAGSGQVWRAYDASPADGTELSGLLLSVSDVAGTYEENNPSATNPNQIEIGEYVEYDWLVENNVALQKSSYCFRVIENDGTELSGYDVYPTVRTSGYTPIINNWRWYDDENSLTPVSPLAAENSAPGSIANGEILKLRVSVTEVEGAPGSNIKFNLQYSEYPDFRDAITLTSTSTCSGNSLWCYADGVGVDNDVIDTTVLSGVDACVSGVGVGCGTVNEAEGLSSGYSQPIYTTSEHEFTLRHDGARVNAVYYFRLVDATNGANLFASSTYPSLVTEGAVLTFAVSGIDAQTATEGVVTDATSTATSISFGSLPLDTDIETAQRLTVYTNGTEGYRVFMEFDQNLVDSYGNTITSVPATNSVPAPWETICTGASLSCFGYHAGDNTLYEGSLRFVLDDSYAGIEAGPVEVMGSSVPVTFDVSDVVYRTRVGFLQSAGDYTTTLRYIVVPVF